MKVLLVSTYELGHQPFGLASPVAWLAEAGAEVICLDLAIESLDEEAIRGAGLIAIYLPMHTATRLAGILKCHFAFLVRCTFGTFTIVILFCHVLPPRHDQVEAVLSQASIEFIDIAVQPYAYEVVPRHFSLYICHAKFFSSVPTEVIVKFNAENKFHGIKEIPHCSNTATFLPRMYRKITAAIT